MTYEMFIARREDGSVFFFEAHDIAAAYVFSLDFDDVVSVDYAQPLPSLGIDPALD